uniref:Uncharacterized protein n=1 Tax=Anguilla anguilla TaxID=7936 RepID=A0A0E9UH62_ANGAN
MDGPSPIVVLLAAVVPRL